jgi:hypothetical protein
VYRFAFPAVFIDTPTGYFYRASFKAFVLFGETATLVKDFVKVLVVS